MVYCLVPTCKSNDWNKKEGRSFHRIPKKDVDRKKWLVAIFGVDHDERNDENLHNPGARVCSDHFKPSDFSISTTRKSLLTFAIPSVFAKAVTESHSCELSKEQTLESHEKRNTQLNRSPLSGIINETNQENLHFQSNSNGNPYLSPPKKKMSLELVQCQNVEEKTDCDNINQYSTPRKEILTPVKASNSTKVRRRRLLFESYSDKTTVVSNSNKKLNISNITDTLKEKCTEEKAIQVSVPVLCRRRKITSTRKQSRVIYKLKKKIEKLKNKVSQLVTVNKQLKKEMKENEFVQLRKIVEDSKTDLKASFLLEQVLSFQKEKMPYIESTLKICCILFRKSQSAYEFIRDLGILRLPHRVTLARYVGHSSGGKGINDLVKLRLNEQFGKIQNEHETLGSLVMDEMSIKPKLIYDRNMDTFFGQTASTGEDLTLATHLLCFVFHGIATNIRIPVSFYFTANTDGVTLHKYCLEVMNLVEESGFVVLRFVSDNAKINTMAYKIFGNGTLTHVIPHPLDGKRKLFFAFDQSHLIKNLRSLFLSRDMTFIGLVITADFIKKLYNMQKENLVKPVRFLTRKVVFPNNLEKMNVLRAIQIFSKPLTSALKTMLHLRYVDEDQRENLEATIFFMETIRKWYEIHDIANRTHAFHSRNDNKIPFSDLDDERLEWLLEDFLPFLSMIQVNATNKMERLSDETYEALQLTTRSTVDLIKYLLEGGFHYVLTRKLSSDVVEMTFSHLRGSGGRNDQMDVRAATLSIERSLKVGIIKSSGSSNVGSTTCLRESLSSELLQNNRKSFHERLQTPSPANKHLQPVLSWRLMKFLNQMEVTTGHDFCMVTIRNCSVALIGGYIVRVAEENTNCPGCLEKLIQPNSEAPLLYLIKANDNGGLKYPSRLLICLLVIVLDFVQSSIAQFPKQNILATYVKTILPYFQKPLKCEDDCGNLNLSKLLLEKFLRPLLYNYAKDVSDRKEKVKKFRAKPLSRKLLKV